MQSHLQDLLHRVDLEGRSQRVRLEWKDVNNITLMDGGIALFKSEIQATGL